MTDPDPTDVWYLIGSLDVGGANRVLVELANNLPSERYDITVWTLLDDNPLAADLDGSVTHRSLSAIGTCDVRSVGRFLSNLRDGPDVLQSFCLYDNLLASLAGAIYRDLTVVTGIRSVPRNPDLRRRAIDRFSLQFADHVVSNSESGAALATRRGVDAERVHTIPNGRDLSEYAEAQAPAGLYDELDIDEDSPVVGTVGRLLERKGHHELVAAWPRIRERYPNAHLIVVGDGPYRSTLESAIASTGEGDSIRLLGRRDDVPELMAVMDLFVFPSHFEGFPNAVMEAMAAGLPIVATPVDGNVELITDDQTGRFVPVGDVHAIARVVIDMLDDPETADSLGEAARARVFECYSVDAMVSSFDALYRQIA